MGRKSVYKSVEEKEQAAKFHQKKNAEKMSRKRRMNTIIRKFDQLDLTAQKDLIIVLNEKYAHIKSDSGSSSESKSSDEEIEIKVDSTKYEELQQESDDSSD